MKTRLINSFILGYQRPILRILIILLGLPLAVVVLIDMLRRRSQYRPVVEALKKDQRLHELKLDLREKLIASEINKRRFFHESLDESDIERSVDKQLKKEFPSLEQAWIKQQLDDQHLPQARFGAVMVDFLENNPVSWALGILMIPVLYIYSRPTLRFIVQRLIMMVFVIFGVTLIVFTLMYFSPSDPAVNILGTQAAPESIENFRRIHGLDQPYLVQLGRTIKGILTFDLGLSYEGNLPVVSSILRRFPVTLTLTLMALTLSLTVALPAGVYAAVKSNSTFDHLFMLIALIGISIPSFWQGLIFILTFSIRLGWLPATYNASNYLSLLMPAFILGTQLMASVARMTRSSTLEVINEDYILTARSKGIPRKQVILRHAVPNALIPIITVIGLQFGGMLGGSAVTEKVFNISGVGSYIVDKQFVPDTPSILAGVIYIAIILSIVNLVIDLLYSFIDPRIRSRIQSGQIK